MRHPLPIILLLVLGTVFTVRADHPTLSLDEGGPGPLTTISAITLSDGDFAISFQSQFLFNDEISDAALERYALLGNPVHSTGHVASYSLNSGLGIGERFMLGFSFPYIVRSDFREAEVTTARVPSAPAPTVSSTPVPTPRHGGKVHTSPQIHNNTLAATAPTTTSVANVISYDIKGLGDATLFGQYMLVKNENSGTYFSLLGGLKMPTGATGERGPGGFLIATDHQPGTGSWDPLLGLAATRQFGSWSFDLNGLYTFSTEGARNTIVGDIFNYNAAVSYRILGAGGSSEEHHNHTGEAHHEHDHVDRAEPVLDLFIEANGDYREAAETSGVVDGNTGGNVIFLSGGSRLAFPSGWAAAFSVGTPVHTDLNGIQSEPNLRLLLGLSKAF